VTVLAPFFQSLSTTWLSQLISTSTWAFAVIESVHLLALAMIGGAVLVVDLRLLGFGLRDQPLASIARAAQPWLVASLVTLLVTGFLLFMSEPVKCYYSYPFRYKMLFLLLGTIFAFTIRKRVTEAGEERVSGAWMKVVALVSLALWFGVGAGGRWIGFSG
jgi:hypothetical protein